MSVVAIESDEDSATKRTCQYRVNNVYNAIGTVKLLRGDAAKRHPIRTALLGKNRVSYITGSSHGRPDCLEGKDCSKSHSPAFQIGKYLGREVRGRIAHFLACHTAKDLGPDFIQRGCRAYIGYEDVFTFNTYNGQGFDFESLAFACDAEVDFTLYAGQDAATAHRSAVDAFEHAATYLISQGYINQAAVLRSNKRVLCLHGQGSATL